MSSLSLMVLAAGMGSRYGGLKQVDPMGPSGETLLDYSVFDALRSGFDQIVFVIRRDIEDEFRAKVGRKYEGRINMDYAFQQLDALPGNFTVPAERTKPWGTAHAIWCARDVVKTPFVAINADDFYGLGAYETLGGFMKDVSPSAARFAMAGYRLDKTLSENGSVSRGVCQVDEQGQLLGIEECTAIEYVDGRIVQKEADDSLRYFTGGESASMNFWGLTPAAFPLLEKHLISFLEHSGKELKTECYIPTVLGEMVKQGEATMQVLPTDAPWFGVTYREDKPHVMASLAALHAAGDYPASLWT